MSTTPDILTPHGSTPTGVFADAYGSPSLITAARELQAVPGAERSGGSYYNEHNAYAAAWLRRLIANGLIAPGVVDERSITEIEPHELTGYTQCHFFAGIGGWSLALRLAGWPDDEPVWTGSCPCQPFSSAGQRKVDKDERHLWPAFRDAIAKCRPSVCFGEQVASEDGRIWLAGIRSDLEALGYGVGAADLCAASVGAPHVRQRLFWGAYSKRAGLSFRVLGLRETDAKLASAMGREAAWHQDRPTWNREPELSLLANGIPAEVAASVAFGNAIVPEVAAEFVIASREAASSVRWAAGAGRGASQARARNGASTGNSDSTTPRSITNRETTP